MGPMGISVKSPAELADHVESLEKERFTADVRRTLERAIKAFEADERVHAHCRGEFRGPVEIAIVDRNGYEDCESHDVARAALTKMAEMLLAAGWRLDQWHTVLVKRSHRLVFCLGERV